MPNVNEEKQVAKYSDYFNSPELSKVYIDIKRKKMVILL